MGVLYPYIKYLQLLHNGLVYLVAHSSFFLFLLHLHHNHLPAVQTLNLLLYPENQVVIITIKITICLSSLSILKQTIQNI